MRPIEDRARLDLRYLRVVWRPVMRDRGWTVGSREPATRFPPTGDDRFAAGRFVNWLADWLLFRWLRFRWLLFRWRWCRGRGVPLTVPQASDPLASGSLPSVARASGSLPSGAGFCSAGVCSASFCSALRRDRLVYLPVCRQERVTPSSLASSPPVCRNCLGERGEAEGEARSEDHDGGDRPHLRRRRRDWKRCLHKGLHLCAPVRIDEGICLKPIELGPQLADDELVDFHRRIRRRCPHRDIHERGFADVCSHFEGGIRTGLAHLNEERQRLRHGHERTKRRDVGREGIECDAGRATTITVE